MAKLRWKVHRHEARVEVPLTIVWLRIIALVNVSDVWLNGERSRKAPQRCCASAGEVAPAAESSAIPRALHLRTPDPRMSP